MPNSCAAIVVTHNGKKWYDRCFQSLLSSSVPLEIIAVDNKSTDDTVTYIIEKFPKVKIIQNNKNAGFAKANNIGLGAAYNRSCDYFFLLNQDAWIERDTIETLIAVAGEKKDFGILSPVHLTANKSSFDKGFRDYFHNNSDTIHAYENLYLKKTQPVLYESRFVNAAAWLVTRKCVDTVGGFDTIMFKHYGEDDNYCQRVLFHKLKIGIVPSATICHDRENRADGPRDRSIGYFVEWGNVLLTKRMYLKRLMKIFLKAICGRTDEMFFVIINFMKISKSRKINRIRGKGMAHIKNCAGIYSSAD